MSSTAARSAGGQLWGQLSNTPQATSLHYGPHIELFHSGPGTSRHRSIAVTPPMLTATPAAGPAPLCRPAAIEPRLTLQRGAFSYAPAATRRTFPPPVGRRISNAARDSNRFLPTKPSARPPKSFAIGKRSRPTHRHKYDDYPSTNVLKIPIDASSGFYPFKTHAHRSARCRDRAASDWAASSRSTAAHTRSA